MSARERLIRVGAWLALALLAAHTWAGQVQPAAHRAAWGSVLAGLVVAAILWRGGRTEGPRRSAMFTVLAAIAALVLALATSGIELRLLLPDRWDELASGVTRGLDAVPNVGIPYAGLDPWTRAVIVLGGTLLATASAWLTFGPTAQARGHPFAAAVLLGLLYAIPVVERSPRNPFLSGAFFTLLLAAFLWGDGLRADQARVGSALTGVCVLLALVVAPRVDGALPIIDYEQIVTDALQPRGAAQFSWSHSYGPLDWPRDGREVLRVKARQGSYWKAAVLMEFDGREWRETDAANAGPDTEFAADPSYRERIQVVVRNLRSVNYLGAGTTTAIANSPRSVLAAAPGTWRTGTKRLQRGDTYRAQVYVPRPASAVLRSAGVDYPDFTQPDLTMRLPLTPAEERVQRAPGNHALVQFPFWGTAAGVRMSLETGEDVGRGEDVVLHSPYGRMYRLAQRLRAGSATPYAFVRAVRARVQRGARYTEKPRVRRYPLDAFLFTDHEGYCQQFSGAMALLLRMGGVPARVASGFTSGSFSIISQEWVVRDLDAHSWVEAYFPRIGWVAFDPTPSIAPPRSQLLDSAGDPAATEPTGGARTPSSAGDRLSDPRIGDAVAATDTGSSGPGTLTVVAVITGVGLLGAGLVAARRRRRLPRPWIGDPPLQELLRALYVTGRAPSGGVTLAGLERTLREEPGAAAYLRTVRAARYGPATGAAVRPSAAERAALRRALGDGLGPAGRFRALLALPPRPSWPRRLRRRRAERP